MLPKDHVVTSSNIAEGVAWAICACGQAFTCRKYEASDPAERISMAALRFRLHREHEFYVLEHDR